MQKSIFTKYFAVCASLIIITVTTLGIVFMVFTTRYFKEDKYKLLRSNAKHAALILDNDFKEKGTLDTNSLTRIYSAMARTIDSTFTLTNTEGTILMSTDVTVNTTNKIPQKVTEQLSAFGEYAEMGKLGDAFLDQHYTVATAVKVDNRTIAYVFVSTNASKQIQGFSDQIFKIFLLSSCVVLVLAFIIVYFVSLQMVKPLRQMSLAAQRFGSGDFTARIDIYSLDEMGQLAIALNNMAKSLSAVEIMRRSFVANISHELKTPMTTISGFIDGILDGTIPPEKHKHYLNIVSEEIKRLSRLVKTMLNLSRIEAGEMTINTSKINIVDTICQALFSFELQIEKKNITIKGLKRDKLMVDADPELIHQVIYNLTENAVKFVDEGGYIEFNFKESRESTHISIKNSGSGLSQEESSRIFDRFYKTDKSRGLDKDGVGLGLYIVRSIINLHGGDIGVKSVKGEFVDFEFSIANLKNEKSFDIQKRFKKS